MVAAHFNRLFQRKNPGLQPDILANKIESGLHTSPPKPFLREHGITSLPPYGIDFPKDSLTPGNDLCTVATVSQFRTGFESS